MTEHTIETEAVADLATRATKPHELTEGGIYSVISTDGMHHLIDLDKDEYRDTPRRKTGTVTAHDAATFCAYVNDHTAPGTQVWADADAQRLVAVLNGHHVDAGWADHRAAYGIRHTPAWTAWKQLDGQLLAQTRFAEHIESRAIDIVRPTGADMLELAQSITATVGVSFESSKRLSNGERQLEYKETVDARAGRRGQLDIPADFELGLTPFEGAKRYKVLARLRYRITDGTLVIGYQLERPEDVLRQAFEDVVAAVADGVTQPVFRGVPV